MRKFFVFATLLLAVLAFVPAGTDAQDKNAKKKTDVTVEETTPQDYASLGQMKETYGKIAAVDVKAGTMTLTVEMQHWELNKDTKDTGKNVNQNTLKYQQAVMKEYQQIMAAKSAVQRQQGWYRLQQTMAQMQAAGVNLQSMFHIVKTNKNFDLEIMDSLKVARATLEVKYDDMGEIIKYSDDQLKKLKSPDVTGGYTASSADVTAGQGVKLFLSPPKKKVTDDSKSDKSQPDATVALPRVRMVLIINEAPEPPATKAKDDKKKKKV